MLEKISKPHDVSSYSVEELKELASEIRNVIIDTTVKNGGHLASNLGSVELIIALNYVFDMDFDKIVYDVGHQSYTHKLLTGRKEKFDSLRKFGGISGFPNKKESKYDLFTVGHSGSSISQAAGLAAARDLKGEKYDVISVVGDASLTNGMSFEAMNNVGPSKQIIILNDNNMSISKNVGSVSRSLAALRENSAYKSAKKRFIIASSKDMKTDFSRLKFFKKVKNSLKYALMDGVLFEEFGIKYLGPVDGHNFEDLIKYLNIAKNEDKSIIIHVVTKKGKGCIEAEKDPALYHGIDSCFAEKSADSQCFSKVFGEEFVKIAQENPKIVSVCCAMATSLGLSAFKSQFPERFFDEGIAEEHAVTFASGLATSGYHPFVSVYSSFLQRAYDQILEDVVLQDLPVTFCVDRAGIVGEDGETHQGIFDLSMFSSMPESVILEPSSANELKKMLNFASNFYHPLFIRYNKGDCINEDFDFEFSKWKTVRGDFSMQNVILTHGANMMRECLKIKSDDVCVVNCSTIKPLDESVLNKLSGKNVLVCEDVVENGSLFDSVSRYFAKNDLKCKLFAKNCGERFLTHGKVGELLKFLGLDFENLTEYFLKK